MHILVSNEYVYVAELSRVSKVQNVKVVKKKSDTARRLREIGMSDNDIH